MKKIVFTLCSNNYLALAKVLVDSFFEHNQIQEYHFIIGLCDRKSDLINYNFFENCTIIEVEDLDIPNFQEMSLKYNIIELNTFIKPYYFKYIFEKVGADLIYFLDPDIRIYNSFSIIEEEMFEYDILLTPHIQTPIPVDGYFPEEDTFLNYGLYNLGFLALRKSPNTFKLLNWLSLKLENKCFNNVSEGYFVDQLPMNFVPIFFDKVVISNNFGLNMAYWNLHERKISIINGKNKINETENLVFFHFSSFKPEKKDEISHFLTRFRMTDQPLLKQLFDSYYERLMENKYLELKNLPCFFVQRREEYLEKSRLMTLSKESVRKKIMRVVKRRMPQVINSKLSKYNQL